MLTDVLGIGLRPTLAGVAVLIIAAVAGWGMAAHGGFIPVRAVRFWMERVILRALHHRRWSARAAIILCNNTAICALLVLAGGWPGGSWTAVTVVGLSMGIALRSLAGSPEAPGLEALQPDSDAPPKTDLLLWLGLLLNLIEVPAIIVTLGLSMGQLASPNDLSPDEMWGVFLILVTPALLVAAAGEALWIGRRQPFRSAE